MGEQGETLNMYDGDSRELGQSRLKPQIVVTREWYEDLCAFLAVLQLLADGVLTDEDGKFIERDLQLKKILIEYQFDDFAKWAESLRGKE